MGVGFSITQHVKTGIFAFEWLYFQHWILNYSAQTGTDEIIHLSFVLSMHSKLQG